MKIDNNSRGNMSRSKRIIDVEEIYIQEKIKLARNEAGESQEDLARALGVSRVTISDIERGRINIKAKELCRIATHYDKPISFFYPTKYGITKEDLTALDEELLFLFYQLPLIQQNIAIEYVKVQVEIIKKAYDRKFKQELENFKR